VGHGRTPRARPNQRQSPVPGRYPVRFGEAELARDTDRPTGWLLSVDGVAQSYVDLDDPMHLEFDYVRRIADIIDCVPPDAMPLDVLHIGGGACTVPRYIAATRPGSRQLVIEADGGLVDLVREQLDLRAVSRLKVRVGDGREGVASRHDASADLVVVDAFERALMPGPLTTMEFTADVRRVLRPGGTYVANLADGGALRFARRFTATLRAVFDHVAVLAEPGVLRGRRFGNLVAVASMDPLPLPVLVRRAAGAAFPARCVPGQEFSGAVEPLTDETSIAPPAPPPDALGRR
jgi:spermidine synthase